jgi:hypothetical protein
MSVPLLQMNVRLLQMNVRVPQMLVRLLQLPEGPCQKPVRNLHSRNRTPLAKLRLRQKSIDLVKIL